MRIFILLLASVIILLSGCAPAVLIGVGATGVAYHEEDQIKEEVNHDYNVAYYSSLSVLSSKGVITAHDKKLGKIYGRITVDDTDYDVLIEVKELEDNKSKIYVKVRKNLIPNMELANEILDKIVAKTKE